MKKNKKLLIGIAIVVIAVAFIIGVRMNSNHDGDKVIRIGMLSFLTGNFAEMGYDLVNGAQLAVDNLNKNNRNELGGDNSKRFELIVEDGKVEPKTTVAGFRKLMLNDLAAAIVAGDTPVPAVAPLIKSSKIPTVATIVSTSDFLDAQRPWIFRNYVSIKNAAKTICQYTVRKLNSTSVSIIYMQSEYGIEGAKSFRDEFISLKGNILGFESYMPDAHDAKHIISKALVNKPDVVYVVGYGIGYNTVVNQIREYGFDGIILTDEPISSPGSISAIKDFTNIIFTSQDAPDTDNYKNFVEEYKLRFNKAPSLYAAYGYDSAMIVMQAINAGGTSNEEIKARIISGVDFQTLRGKIAFRKDGDCVLPIIINKMSKDGSYSRER